MSVNGLPGTAANPVSARKAGTGLASHCHNHYRDFRATTCLLVSLAILFLAVPTVVVDLLTGDLKTALIVGLGVLPLLAVISLVVFFERVNLAAHAILLIMLSMLGCLLWFRDGVTLGFYVGVPTMMMLASTIVSIRAAVFYWILCTGMVAVASWLSFNYWQGSIEMTDKNVVFGALRAMLIILGIHLFFLLSCRGVMSSVGQELAAKSSEIDSLKRELDDAQRDRSLFLNLVGKMSAETSMVGWKFDAATGHLSYSTVGDSGGRNVEMVDLDRAALGALPGESWQRKLLDFIDRVGSEDYHWSKTLTCNAVNGGERKLYLASSYAELGESGSAEFYGTLKEVSDQ